MKVKSKSGLLPSNFDWLQDNIWKNYCWKGTHEQQPEKLSSPLSVCVFSFSWIYSVPASKDEILRLPTGQNLVFSGEKLELIGVKHSGIPLQRAFVSAAAEAFYGGLCRKWRRNICLSEEGWAGAQDDWENLSMLHKPCRPLWQSAMHHGRRQDSTKNRWAGKQVRVCLSGVFLPWFGECKMWQNDFSSGLFVVLPKCCTVAQTAAHCQKT